MRLPVEHLSWRHIVAICIISAVARVAYTLLAQPPIPVAEDYAIARHLAGGDGFSIYDRGPTSIKGPLYPTYLAVWLWMLGEQDGLRVAILVQHLLYAAMPLLLFQLGRAIERPVLGAVAAVLFALHPTYFYHATVAENTTWVVVMSALWGILVFRQSRYPIGTALVVGAIVGSFIVEKPLLAVPMVVIIGVRWWWTWQRLATVAMAAALLVLPWTVRGIVLFGEPTLTKSYSSYLTFVHSWLPDMVVHPRYAVPDTVERALDSLVTLPERQALPALRSLAKGIVATHWTLIPERSLVHALVFWTIPPRYWHNWSLAFVAVRIVPVVLLTVLWVWGMVILWRQDRGLLLSILGIVAWVTLVYSLYHVLNIRYKLEVEWLELFVCAAPLVPNRLRSVDSSRTFPSPSPTEPIAQSLAARLFAIAAIVSVVVGGCSSSLSSNDGSTSMTAIIGSQQWIAAPGMIEATNADGVIAIAGTDATGAVQVQLRAVGIRQPGTVQIGAGQPHAATLSDNGTLYIASNVAGSGTITFNELTSAEAEGTFSFVGFNAESKLPRNVTSGKFSVRFK